MADGLFVPNAAGAVRTLARGLGVQKQNRQAQANVERQFQFQEEQKAVENAALIEGRKRQELLNELARGEKRTSDHKFAERFPDAFDKQITRNNAITDELYPGSPNLSGAKIRANLPTWQKDIALEQSYIKEFGEGSPEHVAILNDIIPNYIDRPIEQKILGGKIGGIEKEEAVAKGLAVTKELETFKTDEEIRQDRARAETLAGIKEEATTAEQERLGKLLDDAGLDAETKSKIMIAAQAGIGAPAEAALFPKTKEDVRFMPTFNEDGERTGAVPVKTFTDPKTGKFVFQQAEKFAPEQAAAGVQEPGAPPTAQPQTQQPIGIPSYLADADQRKKNFFNNIVAANEGRVPTEEQFNAAFAGAEETLSEANRRQVEATLPKVKLAEFIKTRSKKEQDFYVLLVRGSGIIPSEKEFDIEFKKASKRFGRGTIDKATQKKITEGMKLIKKSSERKKVIKVLKDVGIFDESSLDAFEDKATSLKKG